MQHIVLERVGHLKGLCADHDKGGCQRTNYSAYAQFAMQNVKASCGTK